MIATLALAAMAISTFISPKVQMKAESKPLSCTDIPGEKLYRYHGKHTTGFDENYTSTAGIVVSDNQNGEYFIKYDINSTSLPTIPGLVMLEKTFDGQIVVKSFVQPVLEYSPVASSGGSYAAPTYSYSGLPNF